MFNSAFKFFGSQGNMGWFSASTSALTFSFVQVPYSNSDILTPARGAEMWNDSPFDDVSQPKIPPGNTSFRDAYYRFSWPDIEVSTLGSYDWSKFDTQIQYAINNNAKFSFGIMTCYNGSFAGAGGINGMCYPTGLHTQMQGEANPDWQYSDGTWVPNWNSINYLAAYANLVKAINNHITATTYNGVKYKDVIGYIDIRGYGNFGEWHTYPWYNLVDTPKNTVATSATLKSIIDIHLTGFSNFPLVSMIGGFDNRYSSYSYPGTGSIQLITTDVTYKLLTATNNWGRIGWRRDNWGDPGYDVQLVNNTYSYSGLSFSNAIMSAYTVARVVGEPSSDAGTTLSFYDLEREIRLYHASSFGNGNYNGYNGTMATNVQNSSKASGYRLILTGGSILNTISHNIPFNISLNWRNLGVAPVYEDWNVTYELQVPANKKVMWSGTSAWSPKFFLSATTYTSITDTFIVGSGVTAGTYNLVLKMRDPNGYRSNMPLYISGITSDNGYILTSGLTVNTSSLSNQVNLIVLVGESNAAGRGNNTTFTDDDSTYHIGPTTQELASRRLKILNESNSPWIFENLYIGQGSPNNQTPGGTSCNSNPWNGCEHGIELGLANELDAGRLSFPSYVVKAGYGGLRIQQMLPASSPNGTDGGAHWNSITGYVSSAITLIISSGYTPKISVFMSEGLNDRFGSPVNLSASTVKPYFQEFISDFRAKYGSTIPFYLTKFRPAIMGSVAEGNAQYYDYNSMFDSIAATDQYTKTLEVSGTTWWFSQGDHWDYSGLKLLASRMVNKMLGN